MDICEATRRYEAWMRHCTTVVEAQLRHKHARMRADLFAFCRGTFYRWVQLWPEVCGDLRHAPRVLAVGDLHVDSFGTWRDAEGRLCWGVDDFDEAYTLPYANDLIRLAASAKIVIDAEQLALKFKDACDAILEGYRETLREGGWPFVLAERETSLERLGLEAIRPPEAFWSTMRALPTVHQRLPKAARQLLDRVQPDADIDYRVVRREAGMGSLGQPRFVTIAEWNGGLIAREAKALIPSACVWIRSHGGHGQSWYARAIRSAVRSRDPFQFVAGAWRVRRLSPDANPIEMANLPKHRDEEILLHAMGSEAANVHVGSRQRITSVLADLRGRKPRWLRAAARDMADAIKREWKAFRKAAR
jgi:uncharacterized protein (DUF2252 family)